jgi:glycosyltransferase involved in cell wall biosynthesis
LDSIYALSLKPEEFEVIFIDDCSTDNTVSIIEDLKSQVSNLTLLRQPKNNRQGAARNRGVSVAKGEYICFVDSDDAVTEGIVDAIRLAKEKQTDMTAFHLAFVDEKGQITKENDRLSFPQGQVFSGIELQNRHSYWFSGPVAYVYNRAFLERVNYPFVEGVLFEDSDFVVVHLYHACRMSYSWELGYLAYEREGSTTRSVNYKNVTDYLLLGVRMMRFYERIMSEGVRDLESESEKFAEGILEGSCFNIARSCKQLVKLNCVDEVRAYYNRLDANVSRKDICADVWYRKYYWNAWTSLCLGHQKLATMLLAVLIPVYKFVKR